MPKAKRTPEGLARHKAQSKELKRKRREDPEYRKEEARKASERYKKNKEKHRIISLRWQNKNKEVVGEKRRRFRRENPELARAADKRCRESSLTTAIRKFKRGELGFDELNQRLNEALVRVNDRTGHK